MRSSDLTHRVIVQRFTEARNSFGEPIETWTNFSTPWASIEYATGSEGYEADRERSEVPATVKLRRSSATMSLRGGVSSTST